MHADHFIWSSYGTWMPGCPRESWPRYMHTWERSRQKGSEQTVDPYRVNRMAAEKTLRFPPVYFTPRQIQAIAEGFERSARSRHAWVWACCVMPDHVQLLITCPRTPPSQMMGILRSEATKRLSELNLHPMTDFANAQGQKPLMWSHTKWHLQLKDDESIHQAIDYVQSVPERQGQPAQQWNFVREFHSLDRCREEAEEYEVQAIAG